MTIIPPKLKVGDQVRVIAPARSLAMPWLDEELQQIALNRFKELGLNLSFGKHINEIDDFNSSSIESRIEDLHDAFADKDVKMLITVIGGFNSNQLLQYIDYDLIKNNPKIICGYSDITALSNAIYAKTGLVTYSGTQFFSFGMKEGFEYTIDYFKKCLMAEEPFEVVASKRWSDDRWAGKQDDRHYFDNDGYWLFREGEVEGTIVGGNQCTLNLLQGTEYMPNISDSILFIEDDGAADAATFDRDLQSLIHQPDFGKVKGIVFGRFQLQSGMTQDLLRKIIESKKELKNLPIIANVDFGHTSPMITFPIGGTAKLVAKKDNIKLEIIKH